MSANAGTALSGRDHLAQSVCDILSTPIGSRVMRRNYGSNLPDLIDAPMTPDLMVEIYAETAVALDQWEPRFKLSRVGVAEANAGHLVLDLEGEYLPDGSSVTLEGIVV